MRSSGWWRSRSSSRCPAWSSGGAIGDGRDAEDHELRFLRGYVYGAAEDRRRITHTTGGAAGRRRRRVCGAGDLFLGAAGRPARQVRGDGGEQPPAHARAAGAARRAVRPPRQGAGREPQLLHHFDRPRAHQGSRSHGAAAVASVAGLDSKQVQQIVDRQRGEPALPADRRRRGCVAGAGRGGDRARSTSSCRTSSSRRCRRGRYPTDALAAHLFGYVGEASEAQVGDGVAQGAIIGQSGIEQVYNKLLMGEDGARRVVVNSIGPRDPRRSRRCRRPKAAASS